MMVFIDQPYYFELCLNYQSISNGVYVRMKSYPVKFLRVMIA